MTLNILFESFTRLRERCEFTEVRTMSEDPDYELGAVVPSGHWSQITTSLEHALAATPRTEDNILVEIVRPPDSAIAPPEGPETVYLGQALGKPNMLTTTDNYPDGRRIGLHFDNWDKLSYATKHTGRRRFAVNLGPGSRYIVLGFMDAQTVCRAVHRDYEQRHPHSDDLRRFVADGQAMACLRIRLAPGEGYIVPTEFLPHDGSTEGLAVPSVAAFWLGRWPRGILPSVI
ncbi:hypothetical protein [Streptomyces coffeae]|uniref:Uncharacterized protein n=1 Tax=Streptomyces coffeae TaxID=621382 RepID=A0ABS1NIN5_9ACTN|nr:hypothetical protein [Streptomyces coffeae]MBL1099933.1 hypothetical protein [Streptomyces coffeae]